MNFFKKRLKTHKKGHDDDDDLDDYIPPVPPHPDEIAKQTANNSKHQQQQSTADLLTCDSLPTTGTTEAATPEETSNSDTSNKTPSGLPSRTKVDRNKEEWKFFEQLTAKVEETVTRTQSHLDELKKASAAEEISKKSGIDDEDDIPIEDDFFDESEQPVGVVAKGTSNWIALEDESAVTESELVSESVTSTANQQDKKERPEKPPPPKDNTSDSPSGIVSAAKSETLTGSEFGVTPSALNTVDLLDDFGFGEEPKPSEVTKPSDVIFDYENDYLDDPFDTSFVDISIVKKENGNSSDSNLCSINASDLLSKLLNKKEEPSKPRDLSFISLDKNNSKTDRPSPLDPLDCKDNLINNSSNDYYKYQEASTDEPDLTSYLAGTKSPGDPLETDFHPYTSNKLGRSSRYGSTTSIASIMSNPFLADNDFYTPTIGSGATTPFSGAATPTRRRGSTNPFEQSPEDEYPAGLEASAIAALTEDFVKAIGDGDSLTKPETTSIVSGLDIDRSKTTGEPFDPFATINDEFVDSPKRSSVTSAMLDVNDSGVGQISSDDVFDQRAIATELAAANGLDAYLKPEMGFDYLSDVSDNESHSEDESGKGRKSSAFQMDILYKDKDEPPPKFDPLPNVIRKLSLPKMEPAEDSAETSPEVSKIGDSGSTFFDPFTTVIDKDSPSSPKIIGISADLVESITKASASRALELIEAAAMDEEIDNSPIGEVTDEDIIRRKSLSGIVNPAFTDHGYTGEEKEASQGEGDVGIRSEVALESDDAKLIHSASLLEDHATSSSAKEEPSTEPPITTASDTGALAEPVSGTGPPTQDNTFDVFGGSDSGLAASSGFDNDPTDSGRDPFDTSEFLVEPVQDSLPYTDSAAFDAFQAKFDSAAEADQVAAVTASVSAPFDPFASPSNSANANVASSNLKSGKLDDLDGFDIFDPFASSNAIKPPKNTPAKPTLSAAIGQPSKDSFDDDDEDDSFRVVIKSKAKSGLGDKLSASSGPMPLLPPPPKTPTKAFQDKEPVSRSEKSKDDFDEFELFFGKGNDKVTASVRPVMDEAEWPPPALGGADSKRSESLESPQTPLFDDDTSVPLEEFPPRYTGNGWEMYLRHPAKKKLTGNRYWKKVFVRLSENSVIQLFNKPGDTDPFQELPLQPCYSLSEVTSQQYDQYGKIFTVKVQYIFYRERVGVRKGQIAKVMQGQITSVSGLAKLGMPLEHAPQVSQLIKLGSLIYDDIKVFANCIEDAFFRMVIHRDRALTYKTEEIQVTVVDEYYVETTKTGLVTKQLARVRLFMLAFINGMPTIEIGVNDLTRQGKEVVGRHDIIPVVTEEWIRLEAVEFHSSVTKEEFEKEERLIKVHPPDATFIELMRFRVRPPKHRELPLQVTAHLIVTKAKVELRCEVLVPGCISRKYGQIPCEDIAIRMHIPECWIYFFRTEKHLRYGSVKSASRRPGKIKGIERFLGATTNLEATMLEASAGVAKYEHAFHSLVWRIPRLPKEGQGAYTQQLMVCRLPLSSFDQIPDKFYEYVHIEFTMPATTVSHAVVRSISVTNDNPPEKYVRYVSKHEYKTELIINFKEKDDETDYQIAASLPLTSHPVVQESDKEVKDEESDDSD